MNWRNTDSRYGSPAIALHWVMVREIHETGSTIGYFLIGLHAAAALYHHYFVRDNTLKRMLPGGA